MDGAVAGSIVALDGLVSLPSKVPRCQVLVPSPTRSRFRQLPRRNSDDAPDMVLPLAKRDGAPASRSPGCARSRIWNTSRLKFASLHPATPSPLRSPPRPRRSCHPLLASTPPRGRASGFRPPAHIRSTDASPPRPALGHPCSRHLHRGGRSTTPDKQRRKARWRPRAPFRTVPPGIALRASSNHLGPRFYPPPKPLPPQEVARPKPRAQSRPPLKEGLAVGLPTQRRTRRGHRSSSYGLYGCGSRTC